MKQCNAFDPVENRWIDVAPLNYGLSLCNVIDTSSVSNVLILARLPIRSLPSGRDSHVRKTLRRWRLRYLELYEHGRSVRLGHAGLEFFTADEHGQEGLRGNHLPR